MTNTKILVNFFSIKTIIVVISVFCIAFLFSCRNLDKGIPENAINEIPPDVFEDIIYDIYIVDALILSDIVKFDHENIDSIMYESVFKKHNYTYRQFENTISYYTHYNLDSMEIIISNVMDRFNIEKGEIMQL